MTETETGLTTLDVLKNLPQNEYVTEENLSTVINSKSYLSRIQLYGSSSDAVKESKIGQGRFGIPKGETVDDLGPEIDVWVLSSRFKAMQFGNDLTVDYDPQSAEFKRMAEESNKKDSDCVYGREFLLYLPGKGFLTYFMCNYSARQESPNVTACMGGAATLKAQLTKNKKGNKYHVPVCVTCSTPIDLPPLEQAREEAVRFANPKVQEKATEEEVAATGRAR